MHELLQFIRDFGTLIAGLVLSGLLGILWHDLRTYRHELWSEIDKTKAELGACVHKSECMERKDVCDMIRGAIKQLVDEHTKALDDTKRILAQQTVCLTRLDERVANIKEQLIRVLDLLKQHDAN